MRSDEFYDQLSSDYASLNGVSKRYLTAVNRVAACYIDGAESWLDIGTGDGLRAVSLLKNLRNSPRDFSFCDSSAGMVEIAKRHLPQDRVFQWGMTEKMPFPPNQTFEVITLLGNILGHVHPKETRLKQLAVIHSLLSDNGTLLLDFNNRWNMHAYGLRQAGTNILRDLVHQPRSTFTATKSVNGKLISTSVYLGSPKEYRLLLSKSGFHIKKFDYYGYTTGKHANLLTGQGLIQANKEEKS